MYFPEISFKPVDWSKLLIPVWFYIGFYENDILAMLFFTSLVVAQDLLLKAVARDESKKLVGKTNGKISVLSKSQKEDALVSSMQNMPFLLLSIILVFIVLPYSLLRLHHAYTIEDDVLGFSLFWSILLYLVYSIISLGLQVDTFKTSREAARKIVK